MNTKVYDGYDVKDLGYIQLHNALVPLISRGQKVLDLGIAGGHSSSPVAFAGAEMVGVDINSDWLNRCRQAYQDAGLGDQLTTINMDIVQYLDQAPKDHFDVVILSDVLMFFAKSKAKEILAKAMKVLKPGGLLWVTTLSASDSRYQFFLSTHEPLEEDTFMTYTHCGGASTICYFRLTDVDPLFTDLGTTLYYRDEVENERGGVFLIVLAGKN